MTGTIFTPEEKKTKVVGIALTPSTQERLARIAAVNGMTVSQVGRRIIEKFLAELDSEDSKKEKKHHARSPILRAHPR